MDTYREIEAALVYQACDFGVNIPCGNRKNAPRRGLNPIYATGELCQCLGYLTVGC
jgi:hypothetical protein